MRGRLRSKKVFSPVKMLLFICIFGTLANLFPSEMINPGYKRTTFKGLSWITAKSARNGVFDRIRDFLEEKIGMDMFYVLFNIGRLIIAMVMKDYVAAYIPFLQTKTVGQKLVRTMQLQLDEESSADEAMGTRRLTEVELAQRKKALGTTGAAAASGAAVVAANLTGLVRHFISTTKMMGKFVYYVIRMVVMTIWIILNLPRQILLGTLTGLSQAGVIEEKSKFHSVVKNTTLKEIFFDGVAELFHVSDSESFTDIPVTGMPSLFGGVWDSSDSDNHKCQDGTCNVCDRVVARNISPPRVTRPARISGTGSPTTSFLTAMTSQDHTDSHMDQLLAWASNDFNLNIESNESHDS